ncbi:MAG: hypothetical protein HQL52_17775 [Magnetococcales bacterium]|nr:hypothetical protein [Magnetococcales bacterium]
MTPSDMVLPWEDPEGYRELLDAMNADHKPQGATESHLVEELTGIVWRKRRLVLAERAASQRGLSAAASGYPGDRLARNALSHVTGWPDMEWPEEAVRATPEETDRRRADLDANKATVEKAMRTLKANRAGAYERALGALREDIREWWGETLENDDRERFTANATSLLAWLKTEVTDWFTARYQELDNRPQIRMQALGEAFDPHRLDKLARHEIHLDRKFEKTLAMLLKLKELREACGA